MVISTICYIFMVSSASDGTFHTADVADMYCVYIHHRPCYFVFGFLSWQVSRAGEGNIRSSHVLNATNYSCKYFLQFRLYFFRWGRTVPIMGAELAVMFEI